jgi:hypothetical protein
VLSQRFFQTILCWTLEDHTSKKLKKPDNLARMLLPLLEANLQLSLLLEQRIRNQPQLLQRLQQSLLQLERSQQQLPLSLLLLPRLQNQLLLPRLPSQLLQVLLQNHLQRVLPNLLPQVLRSLPLLHPLQSLPQVLLNLQQLIPQSLVNLFSLLRNPLLHRLPNQLPPEPLSQLQFPPNQHLLNQLTQRRNDPTLIYLPIIERPL